MQSQYDKLKKKHEDSIMLFRLGDFYESFDNDAKIISKVLGIVLTGRGKGDNRHPMAGIPYHALDNYLPKLVKAGYKVAIAEQLEEPQKGKKIVDRDIVKIVSAGTITNEKSLSADKNNYIASIAQITTKKITTWGLSICDLTTGEFYISEFYSKSPEDFGKVVEELKRVSPAEILLSKDLAAIFRPKFKGLRLEEVEDYDFNFSDNKKRLLNHFKVQNLKGFGIEKYKAGIIAAGIILNYLIDTQKVPLSHINKIHFRQISKFMLLDENTIRSLELVFPIREDPKATLLAVLDKCLTPMGKRKLYQWIIHPLIEEKEIEMRLDGVEELFKNSVKLSDIQDNLDNIYDIERILGKIGTQSVNARDLLALKDSLEKTLDVSKKLKSFKSDILEKIFKLLTSTKHAEKVIELISKSINEDPPITITEGDIIRDGYNSKLDEINSATMEGRDWIKNLQAQEAKRTKTPSLKVKFNKIFGYYIEVSRSNLDKVPENYIRKQTLVNAERFITPELKEKEDLILNADQRKVELEYKLFVEIREEISRYIPNLQKIAEAIAALDCLSNFAHIARLNEYTRPKISDNHKGILKIENSRHPVVEQLHEEQFIPNDVLLDSEKHQIAIITGPNMAGKSTYIRQVALIVLMAQIGSFVPASSMQFKPVDRIFTRVGASDNLSAGESTFLVEMNEAANILNNATSDSLIILDEVGRGTSTYDGVAIAWAVAEYIHNKIGAKTLFATHYHELVDLEKFLPKVVNYNVSVKEAKNKIIFLRKIEIGGTDKSYGVHVAELAGIPQDVIKKANEILLSLEQEGLFEVKHVESEITEPKKHQVPKQMPLLMSLPENPVIDQLKKLNVNKLSPMEALEMLDEIIKKLRERS